MTYPDVFFTPEYQTLFAPTAFGGKPCVFEAAGIEYRFYKRPIKGTPYYDICSPYGYSGPVEIKDLNWWEKSQWMEFFWGLDDYCKANNIIAEFARIHPWEGRVDLLQSLEAETPQFISVHYERDIVYIDLTQSEEQIWKGFDKGCKSAIKGVEEIWRWNRIPPDFPLTYHDSMKAKGAHSSYLFNGRFFHALSPMATVFGRGTQQAIILRYGDFAHYFLAAGQGKAANAILWESIKWAKTQGCKLFNLGGGLKAGDSLESFKRSFSKTTKPFFTYRKIHNQAIYDELCNAKGIDSGSPGFFPAYRRANGQ